MDNVDQYNYELLQGNNIKKLFDKIGGTQESLLELLKLNKIFMFDKNHLLERALGELRFNFHGGSVPYSIEDDVKTISRDFYSLEVGQYLHRKDNKIIHIKNIERENMETRKRIEYLNTHGKRTTLIMEKSVDKNRGPYPSTIIEYKNNIYRPVRRHGNVANHSSVQEHILDEKVFKPMVKQGILGELDRLLYKNYFIIHDADETSSLGSGDLFAGTKIDQHSNKINYSFNGRFDDISIFKAMQECSGLFNDNQIALNTELFKIMEGPKKEHFAGALELVVYNMCAIDMYKDYKYLNSGMLHAPSIFFNQFPAFTKKNSLRVYFPKLVDSGDINPQELSHLSFSKLFFKENGKLIEEIIENTIKNFESYKPHQRKFFNNDKRKPYYNKRQPLASSLFKIQSLQDTRKTIQREQANSSTI